jgi:hypothetical protein
MFSINIEITDIAVSYGVPFKDLGNGSMYVNVVLSTTKIPSALPTLGIREAFPTGEVGITILK